MWILNIDSFMSADDRYTAVHELTDSQYVIDQANDIYGKYQAIL